MRMSLPVSSVQYEHGVAAQMTRHYRCQIRPVMDCPIRRPLTQSVSPFGLSAHVWVHWRRITGSNDRSLPENRPNRVPEVVECADPHCQTVDLLVTTILCFVKLVDMLSNGDNGLQ